MTDTLEDIAADLCTGPLDEFVSERTARAKAVDDAQLAKQIRALRKPSAAAWVVNVFARERVDRLGQALQLGEELREAQQDLDAATLAELGRQRRALTDQLAREAAALAESRGERVTHSTLEAVQRTLSAAFYDPDAAAAVASQRLLRDLKPSDPVDIDAAVAGGGRGETRPAPPRRPDEVKARRERRDAERAVTAAERALARAQQAQEKTERDLHEATAAADRLTAEVTEMEAKLAQLRDEADRAAATADEIKDEAAAAGDHVTEAEQVLADAKAAQDRLNAR